MLQNQRDADSGEITAYKKKRPMVTQQFASGFQSVTSAVQWQISILYDTPPQNNMSQVGTVSHR